MSWVTDNQCPQIWWWSPWENKSRIWCGGFTGLPKIICNYRVNRQLEKGSGVTYICVTHNLQFWNIALISLSSKSSKFIPTIYNKENRLLPYLQNADTYVLCPRRLVVLRHGVHGRDLKKYKLWSKLMQNCAHLSVEKYKLLQNRYFLVFPYTPLQLPQRVK